jgi:hypothetical protein
MFYLASTILAAGNNAFCSLSCLLFFAVFVISCGIGKVITALTGNYAESASKKDLLI